MNQCFHNTSKTGINITFSESTGCIDIDNTNLDTLLENLSSFDDVTVSKASITKPGNGFSYEIEFVGEKVKGDVGQLEFLVGSAAHGAITSADNVLK